MPIIVDAYNLIQATMPPDLAGLDEAWLCRLLACGPWIRPGRVDGHVICDGVPKPGGAQVSPVPEVELVFSGPRRTADDLIIEQVRQDSAPRRLVVVTSDHEVQRAVRRRKAQVIESQAFTGELLRLHRRAGAAPSPSGGSDDNDLSTEDWMRAMGLEDRDPPGLGRGRSRRSR